MSLTNDEIDETTMLWSRLTDALDYHAKKWYVTDENGDWQELSHGNLPDALSDLGVEESDNERIIQKFIYRDWEAHARDSDEKRAAQLRLGFLEPATIAGRLSRGVF